VEPSTISFQFDSQLLSEFIATNTTLIRMFSDHFRRQFSRLEVINTLILPSGKYFENASKFKSSPQNNGISAALLKQKLCGSGM
jgi:hypothetical protein